jgi:diguanylate cyclase (GGDEF)-like protein
MRNAQIASAVLGGSFLLIHGALLIFFWCFGVMPLAYLNIVSVAYYAVCLVLIYRKHINVCIIGAIFEIALHAIAVAYFVGWDYGFQLFIIGGILIGFFAEYVGRCMQRPYVPAVPLTAISIAGYVIAYFLSGNPAFAENIAPVRDVLQIGCGVLVFSMVAVCMYSLIFVAFFSEVELAGVAAHDKLTGLPNRYYMSEDVADLIAEGTQRFWVAMVDIDDFKAVNDTYGHTYGDEVLKTVADLLASNKVHGRVCRWGGEEFLLAGRMSEGEDALKSQMEGLRKAIDEYSFLYREECVRITVTMGVALYREGESVLQWVSRADAMLYSGKNNGKNQVVYDLT